MDLKTIRCRLEAFDQEISSEHLMHLTGKKQELNAARIYGRYPGLFSMKNVKYARRLVEHSRGLERRKNLYLLGALVNGFMSEPMKELSDKRDTFEAKATVPVDGKDVPFRQVSVMIANTPSHTKRKQLFEKSLPVRKRMMGFDKALLEREWELARKAGFSDYTSLYAFAKECDFDELAVQMRTFLQETDGIFSRCIEEAMKSIGVRMKDAQGFDVSFWIRSPSFDAFFPKEGLVSSLKETLSSLGIDLNSQANIVLDVDDRPQKVPRAFCMPLRIPDEVHLVIKPSGGQNDYKSLFHEAGHSEHYANARPDLPFEFKHLGSHCISETYAFAFEHMIMSAEWLSQHTTMDDRMVKEFLRFEMTAKLFFMRRYAAKLLYELKLHRGDLRALDSRFNPIQGKQYKDMAQCYSDILSKAAKVRIHPINWASDVDGGYYAADYLRAWILEAQLRSFMIKRFGRSWMRSQQCGEFLKSLWKDANKPSPQELCRILGGTKIDMKCLTQEVFEFFKAERGAVAR